MTKLSHLNDKGEARMVDVSDKAVTQRAARAEGFVAMAPATLALVEKGDGQEGRRARDRAHRRHHGRQEDARADPAVPSAGHHQGQRRLRALAEPPGIRVTAEVKVAGPTGVEMEALTAVSVACLDFDFGGDAEPRRLTAGLKVHAGAGDGQRVAERDELVRLLGGHDAGEARSGEHITLLGRAGFHQRQRRGGHGHEALRPGRALRDGLGRDVDHARLALVVEMREPAHYRTPRSSGPRLRLAPVGLPRLVAARSQPRAVRPASPAARRWREGRRCRGPAHAAPSRLRVAAATSGGRIRLSPTRKACTPHLASRTRSA